MNSGSIPLLSSNATPTCCDCPCSSPWHFSEITDTTKVFGKKISKIGYPCLASIQGKKGDRGWGVCN